MIKTSLAVVGAGPGGYVAAFRAADLGLDVTLIDVEPQPGGVCLLRGCIPSKALLHGAAVVDQARKARDFGIEFSEPTIDVGRLRDWKNGIVSKLTQGLTGHCKKRKIRVIQARAEFENVQTLRLDAVEGGPEPPARLRFEKAILAAGSRSIVPGSLRCDDPRVMTSRQALDLPDIPESLLVVGGGYIGLELGQLYQRLGSAVTVVELTDSLLPGTDRALADVLEKRLRKDFAAVLTETEVVSLTPTDAGIQAVLKNGKGRTEQTFSRVLIAVGRAPNSGALGLENTRIRQDARGFVKVDDRMRTAEPHIFAIGDLVGGFMLAHKASYEGKIAAEVIAGHKARFDVAAIPAVVFTDPEIAYCGLTEAEAKSQDRPVVVARFPWMASGRALALDQTFGQTRILFDPHTQRVLGVGMVGQGAGEMISEGVLAVEMAAVAEDLAGIIHPHPTLSETLGEAAEAFLGRAIHIYQ